MISVIVTDACRDEVYREAFTQIDHLAVAITSIRRHFPTGSVRVIIETDGYEPVELVPSPSR
jgi:hypothetical protein